MMSEEEDPREEVEEEEELDDTPSWMRRDPVNNENAQVVVASLPPQMSDREVHRFMSPFGFVKQLDRLDPTYCLVEFFNDLDARRAVLHGVVPIAGEQDVIIKERPGHVWGEKKKVLPVAVCPSALLVIRQIAFRASNEEILRLLGQFGPVKRLVHFFGQSTGWVEFVNPQHAQVALENPVRLSLTLHEKPIMLELAKDTKGMPTEEQLAEDPSGFVCYISDVPQSATDEELYAALIKFGPLRRLTRFQSSPVHYAFAE